jgi:hypothetical protein
MAIRTYPPRSGSAFEESVFQYASNASQICDDINTVIIKLPQFAIMTLRGPPEKIAAKTISPIGAGPNLLLEEFHSVCAHANHDHMPTCINKESA